MQKEVKEDLVYEGSDDDDDDEMSMVNQNKRAHPTSTANMSATAKLRQQLAEFFNEDDENESDCSDDGIETTMDEKVEGIHNECFPPNQVFLFKSSYLH